MAASGGLSAQEIAKALDRDKADFKREHAMLDMEDRRRHKPAVTTHFTNREPFKNPGPSKNQPIESISPKSGGPSHRR
jgi:hypothetical protein